MSHPKREPRSPLIPSRLIPIGAPAETPSELAMQRQLAFLAQQQMTLINNTEQLSKTMEASFTALHARMDRLEAKRKVETTEMRHHIETTEESLERLLSQSEHLQNMSGMNDQIHSKLEDISRQFLEHQKLGSSWPGHNAHYTDYINCNNETAEPNNQCKSDQVSAATSSTSGAHCIFPGHDQSQATQTMSTVHNPEASEVPLDTSSSETSTLHSSFNSDTLLRTPDFRSSHGSLAPVTSVTIPDYPYISPPRLLPARFTNSPSTTTERTPSGTLNQFASGSSHQDSPSHSQTPHVASSSNAVLISQAFPSTLPALLSSRELSPLTPISESAPLLTVDPRVFMMTSEDIEVKATEMAEKSKKRRKKSVGNTSSKRMRMNKTSRKKKAAPVVINGVQWPANLDGETCIHCEPCNRWYHVGCVGIPPNDARLRDEKFQFRCPPCHSGKMSDHPASPSSRGSQECQRPTCQYHATANETYVISRLIAKMYGQQVEGSTKQLCMWLVEWEGYNVLDSTWEWENKMSDPKSLINVFEAVSDKVLLHDAEILKEVADTLPADKLRNLLDPDT